MDRNSGEVDHVRHVQKGAFFLADVHEGGLHPRKNGADGPLVDVPDHPLLFRALHQDLDELPVLQDGDPGLVGRYVDHDLCLQVALASFPCTRVIDVVRARNRPGVTGPRIARPQ